VARVEHSTTRLDAERDDDRGDVGHTGTAVDRQVPGEPGIEWGHCRSEPSVNMMFK
jgi:hypothetical protein